MSIATVMAFWNDAQPNAEELAPVPRAELYARLDRLYAAVERKARAHPTQEGNPPVDVAFAFEREPGRSLSLTAHAGWRVIKLHTWLEDGPAPGQTLMRVRFQPESMQQRAGPGSVLSAVETVLWRTEAQIGSGGPVTALFGGIPSRRLVRQPPMHVEPVRPGPFGMEKRLPSRIIVHAIASPAGSLADRAPFRTRR